MELRLVIGLREDVRPSCGHVLKAIKRGQFHHETYRCVHAKFRLAAHLPTTSRRTGQEKVEIDKAIDHIKNSEGKQTRVSSCSDPMDRSLFNGTKKLLVSV